MTTRRAAVGGGLALMAGTAAAKDDPLAGAALYEDVKTYAGFGHHRTGTRGDDLCTAWLRRALGAAGYEVSTQGFDYPVFELARADVAVGGRRFAGFPMWTPRTTPAGGLAATLAPEAGPGRIALVTLPDGAGGGLGPPATAPVEAAIAAGAAAVVAVTDNRLGEMAVLNALPNTPPWPVPVMIVAGRDGPALRAAADQPAVLRLEGRTVVRRAENVVARRPRPGKHLVISTPKSGWLTCAGERGSGIAVWLGLARWLAAESGHNLTLVATSGHEFDGYGGHLFTERLAPKPAETRLWLHLGANIASYDFALEGGEVVRRAGPPAARLLACSPALVPAATKAFAGQPGYAAPSDVSARRPPGEAAMFRDLGYDPLMALVAGHPLHHTPRDLPDVTGPALLEPVARGLQAVLKSLERA